MTSTSDKIEPVSNVEVLLRDERDRIVDRRESHNVFVNGGRRWLRNLVGSALYPTGAGAFDAAKNLASGDGNLDTYSVYNTGTVPSPVRRTHRIRYVGLGVGGVGQKLNPPGGTYVETVTVSKIEKPVLVASGQWLKQVLAQSDLTDAETFPKAADGSDGFEIRFRALFGRTDVSFAGQPTYATDVPISEVGLFTSEAGRDVNPAGDGGNAGKIGLVAWNTFSTVTKTPNFVLEIRWSLRF